MELTLPSIDTAIRLSKDEKLFAVLDDWRTKVFAKGHLTRAEVEPCTVEFIRLLFLPAFEDAARKGVRHFSLSTAREPTQEGLKAFATLFGRVLASGLDGKVKNVTFPDWGKLVFANAIRSAGRLPGSLDLCSDWTQDPVFIRRWADAIDRATGETKVLRCFALALYWDTFAVPLSYFTDEAACRFLQAVLSGTPGVGQFEIATYRKDIRGSREGLCLSAPEHGDAVVRYDIRADVFYVSISAAAEVELKVAKFSVAVSSLPRELTFELRD